MEPIRHVFDKNHVHPGTEPVIERDIGGKSEHYEHVPTIKVQHVRSIHGSHSGHVETPKVQPYSGDQYPSDMDTSVLSTKTDLGDDSEDVSDIKRRNPPDAANKYWGFNDRLEKAGENLSVAGTALRRSSAGVNNRTTREAGQVFDEKERHHMEGSSGAERKSRKPRPSLPEKLDYKNTAQWLRDFLSYPESYRSKLTSLPEKTTPRSKSKGSLMFEEPPRTGERKESVLSRVLTRQTTASSTIDKKFRRAVSDLEHLMNEAIFLANEVAEREDHKCSDNGKERAATPYPPSVHESLPSVDEQSQIDARDLESHDVPREKSQLEVPGVHSGNLMEPIPKRLSSLPRNKVYAAEGLLVVSQRDSFDKAHQRSDEENPPRQGSLRPEDLPDTKAVHEFIKVFNQPPIQPRGSSRDLREDANQSATKAYDRHSGQRPHILEKPSKAVISRRPVPPRREADSWSFDGVPSDVIIDWHTQYNLVQAADGAGGSATEPLKHSMTSPPAPQNELNRSEQEKTASQAHASSRIDLHRRSHVSLRGYQGFSLARSHPRKPVARDWSVMRKRFVASVACISTALIGTLIGIYAGLVPSIQYYIADMNHYAILGNVVFYFGLAIPSFFFWPLPLLHGRKPYILSSLAVAMPLLFPQAISVSTQRSPFTSEWRWALLLPRGLIGFSLGFASMNFHSILTDLFGASLMSSKPHQEIVDKYDVRRHGGGMGVWLGIWTWCFTGSLGVGFVIGACIINFANPSWGFYTSIIMIAVVLILNVICPEVRRSAFRRSVAEVRKGNQISRRIARGEIMMHRVKDGPKWWGEEVYHGLLLSCEMMRQPGFAIMAVYTGWTYSQIVLIIVLLGSLTSKAYLLQSPLVGLCVAFVAIGALGSVPFQKANLLSRGRQQEMTSADTLKKGFTMTSHLVRRAVFSIVLPLAGIAYTLVSGGPSMPVEVPTLFAALIGNLSGLALSECNGLIMETFDTSDLQPGMTGRARGSTGKSPKRTNYSSFPRVTAGFACCHTLGFIFAAGATGVGGMAQRNLGQRAATGVVAGILLILTVFLLAALIRFKHVQIIPTSKTIEMDKWTELRKENIRRRSTVHGKDHNGRGSSSQQPNTMTDEEIWRPIIIGNPSNKTRRVNLLELGAMTRWTEIRRKNRLIDQSTSAHLNRAALEDAAAAVEEVTGIGAAASELVHRVSNRSRSGSPSKRRHYHSGSPGNNQDSSASGGRKSTPPLELDLTGADNPLIDSGQAEPHSRGADKGAGQGLPDHGQTRGAGQDFSERECVMGQTLVEENEQDSEEDEIESDDDHGLRDKGKKPMYDGHGLHLMNKVRGADLG